MSSTTSASYGLNQSQQQRASSVPHPQAKRCGTNPVVDANNPNQNQQQSAVMLPQSNGVNINIINPTTNVNSGGNGATPAPATIVPNPPDLFVSNNTATTVPPMDASVPLAYPPALPSF
jgi:hypothetical protein